MQVADGANRSVVVRVIGRFLLSIYYVPGTPLRAKYKP